MKSYSDSVADTVQVQQVEQRLALALSEQDVAQNTKLAQLQTDVKHLKFRANISSVLVALIVISDILRYGF